MNSMCNNWLENIWSRPNKACQARSCFSEVDGIMSKRWNLEKTILFVEKQLQVPSLWQYARCIYNFMDKTNSCVCFIPNRNRFEKSTSSVIHNSEWDLPGLFPQWYWVLCTGAGEKVLWIRKSSLGCRYVQ